MSNLRKHALQCTFLGLLVLGLLFGCAQNASAYPYPGSTVECDNYVFVPRADNGSWKCPPVVVPQVIPPGTTPGPDQVSPGGSHPYFNSKAFLDALIEVLRNFIHERSYS